MITAEVLHKSRCAWEGGYATLRTFRLVYPAFIHPHVLTHRDFSRNTSSARAVPAKKFARLVRENPAMPMFWGMDCPGMKAHEQVDDIEAAKRWWIDSCESALQQHSRGLALGVHKEIVNRILQPYQHVMVILSTTKLQNWDEQRLLGEGAQGETNLLAQAMRRADEEAPAVERDVHIPLVYPEELTGKWELDALASAARCARVSFLLPNLPFQQEVEKGMDLLGKKHPSPFEHQAVEYNSFLHVPKDMRNYTGWVQQRALLGM